MNLFKSGLEIGLGFYLGKQTIDFANYVLADGLKELIKRVKEAKAEIENEENLSKKEHTDSNKTEVKKHEIFDKEVLGFRAD